MCDRIQSGTVFSIGNIDRNLGNFQSFAGSFGYSLCRYCHSGFLEIQYCYCFTGENSETAFGVREIVLGKKSGEEQDNALPDAAVTRDVTHLLFPGTNNQVIAVINGLDDFWYFTWIMLSISIKQHKHFGISLSCLR